MSARLMVPASSIENREPSNIHCLSDVVEAIGLETFSGRMLDVLAHAFDAQHCAIFQMTDYELTQIGAASVPGAPMMPKSELTLYEVKRQLSQIRAEPARVELHNVAGLDEARDGTSRRQRVMICARKPNGLYCLRFLRAPRGDSLSDRQIGHLRGIADLLIALIARHVDLFARKPNLTPALTSLDEIQDCVLGATDLSRRESEVCSRILYGLSSCGIALDLGIGKESVMTYRKRAYHRLGIGSQRELLMWYLALWTALRGRDSDGAKTPRVETPIVTRYRATPAAPLLATA